MRLEGPVTQVARSQQTVYAAVNDVEKYKDYMPSAVSSFATGEDYGMPWFSFTIGGMPEIKMVRSVAEPFPGWCLPRRWEPKYRSKCA